MGALARLARPARWAGGGRAAPRRRSAALTAGRRGCGRHDLSCASRTPRTASTIRKRSGPCSMNDGLLATTAMVTTVERAAANSLDVDGGSPPRRRHCRRRRVVARGWSQQRRGADARPHGRGVGRLVRRGAGSPGVARPHGPVARCAGAGGRGRPRATTAAGPVAGARDARALACGRGHSGSAGRRRVPVRRRGTTTGRGRVRGLRGCARLAARPREGGARAVGSQTAGGVNMTGSNHGQIGNTAEVAGPVSACAQTARRVRKRGALWCR
jgi:hypothetical protein